MFVSGFGKELKETEFTVGGRPGGTSGFCCRNTTHIIEIFGTGCPKSSAAIFQEIQVIAFLIINILCLKGKKTYI